MLDNLKIEGYRNLEDFSLKGSTQFNIIVGANNTGKSSILEALSIFCNPLDFDTILNVLNTRTEGIHYINKNYLFSEIDNLFTLKNSYKREGDNNKLKITADWNNNNKYVNLDIHFNEIDRDKIKNIDKDQIHNKGISLGYLNIECNDLKNKNYSQKIKFEEEPEVGIHQNKNNDKKHTIIPSFLCDSLSHRNINNNSFLIFEKTVKDIGYENSLGLFKEVDNTIESFHFIKKEFLNIFQLMVKFLDKKDLLPFTSLGEGLRKMLFISFALATSKNGILLIDELESGIHTTALVKFTKWMLTLAKKLNVQIFITTHSLECIDAILSINEISLGDLSLFKIQRKNNKIISKKLSGESIKKIRYDLGQDIRW